MRLYCRTFRMNAARWVALGRIGELERHRHASTCDGCAEFRTELLGLDASLRSLAAPSVAHPDLETAVWQEADRRIGLRARDPLPIRRAAAAVGLTLFAAFLAWSVWPNTSRVVPAGVPGPESTKGTAAMVASAPDPVVRRNVIVRTEPAEVTTTTVKRGGHSIQKTRLAAQHNRARGRRHRSLLHRSQDVRLAIKSDDVRHGRSRGAKAEPSKPSGPPPQAVWAYWAAWYEQRGDYDRASVAYEQARNAAGLGHGTVYTYEAGRAAECAGNLAGAVDNYSKMLSRASATRREPKAEKGAMKWTPTGNEA